MRGKFSRPVTQPGDTDIAPVICSRRTISYGKHTVSGRNIRPEDELQLLKVVNTMRRIIGRCDAQLIARCHISSRFVAITALQVEVLIAHCGIYTFY